MVRLGGRGDTGHRPGKAEQRRAAARHVVSWMVVQRRAQLHPFRASRASAQRAGGTREPRCPQGRPLLRSAGDSGRRDTQRAGPSPQRDHGLRHTGAGSGRWVSGHCCGGAEGWTWSGSCSTAARGRRGPFAGLMITRSLRGLGGWPPVTRAGHSCSLLRANSPSFLPIPGFNSQSSSTVASWAWHHLLLGWGLFHLPAQPLRRSVVSDSMGSCGLLPARLLFPWDSPGKNTGAGCHFLLQGVFPTQRLSSRLLRLVLCNQVLYPLSHPGSLLST